MKVKKIWANYTVKDIARTTKFYTELGFRSNGASEDLTSFFFGDDDFVIHFFTEKSLKASVEGDIADLKHGNEIIFTLGAERKEEVDQWAAEVKTAGGTIVSAPEEFGKGYYGFVFKDPDGHKFNVFYM
jgi:predicted lactoylglutathione lyase